MFPVSEGVVPWCVCPFAALAIVAKDAISKIAARAIVILLILAMSD